MNAGPAHAGDLPDVTVVVRASDHAATLPACLDSLARQTIGAHRLEVIAIDDGSLDDSGPLLARATRTFPGRLRTGQQPRGMGPAAARNLGLSRATGRYVIFLEGADRLAHDALDRMVAAADRSEADVVLGKPESTGRHSVATSMFRTDQDHADLYRSRVYWSLTPDKLFRTALVRRCGLQFPTDMVIGDDQAFTAAAYVAARNIAVVADRTCVLKGPSAAASVTPVQRVALAARMMALVTALVPAGPEQDRLLSRHLEAELGRATGPLLLATDDPAERERIARAASDVLRARLTPGALALLARPLAVRLALLSSGRFAEAEQMAGYEAQKPPAPKKTVENGRVYTTLPFFRDPRTPLPDALFDITDRMTVTHRLTRLRWADAVLCLDGFAFFEQLSTRDRATHVVFREPVTGAEARVPVTARRDEELVNAKGKSRAMGRFSARADLAGLCGGQPPAPGVWEVWLSVSFEGVTQEVRLGRKRSADVDVTGRLPVVVAPSPHSPDHELAATLFYTPGGDLSLQLAERRPLPVAR
ncbi:glycosyltransferase family A protein [Streptomyces sp. NBC_01500]|uniref:glycosyltransferase family 2 protein n=1 Tax=Streptomyces sp. NBC_01500 TaxID=2903886 RepID=UPI002255AFD1|nr:glycosyltransferase family A protein [Streptomyces sp. NBC_01500]MCX4547468.1 glycosyltransferase family 2 protein [Streptomyces sp. NBC_01500]